MLELGVNSVNLFKRKYFTGKLTLKCCRRVAFKFLSLFLVNGVSLRVKRRLVVSLFQCD